MKAGPDPDDYVDEAAHVRAAERMRHRAAKVEVATSEHMKWIEESGQLAHLYGKPLDLTDDPNWLIARVMKQAGISHPVIEQRKGLMVPLERWEARISRLERQRAWLLQPRSYATSEDVQLFNRDRMRLLEEFRTQLAEVNRAIRDFNLTAPEPLHERPVRVEERIASLEARVPALLESEVASHTANAGRRRWWPLRRRR